MSLIWQAPPASVSNSLITSHSRLPRLVPCTLCGLSDTHYPPGSGLQGSPGWAGVCGNKVPPINENNRLQSEYKHNKQILSTFLSRPVITPFNLLDLGPRHGKLLRLGTGDNVILFTNHLTLLSMKFFSTFYLRSLSLSVSLHLNSRDGVPHVKSCLM